MTSRAEIDRRYANVRAQAQEDGLDAVVVAGSEYSGFEGAVRYLSGFRMLHRYAYVVLPVEGEPSIVFPKEARWVGDHGESLDRGQGLRRAPRPVDRRPRRSSASASTGSTT